jgi:DNA-binding transcriptional LysR family regulator
MSLCARCGSSLRWRGTGFRRAARERRLRQPAVSQQMRLPEQDVGMPLTEQIGRKLRLAPALLLAFTPQYPEVTIKFTAGNHGEIVGLLAANALDRLITGRPPVKLTTAATPLRPASAGDHCGTGAPRVVGRCRIPLAALAEASRIVREEGSRTRASVERLFSSGVCRFAH